MKYALGNVLSTMCRSITTLKFTPSHEWISVQDDSVGTVGITKYAQNALGDVVYLELPEIGQYFKKEDQVNVIESVKAVSHIYAPVSGDIIDVNSNLIQNPSLLNTSPMKEGWLFKIRLCDPKELDSLLSETSYQQETTSC